MLQWSYPRLDVNVSKGINHLLKSPLCVHPKTGRICVPIDPSRLDEFNPFDVPTISQICHELDKIKSELGDSKHKLGMKCHCKQISKMWFDLSPTQLCSLHEDISKTVHGIFYQKILKSTKKEQSEDQRSVRLLA